MSNAVFPQFKGLGWPVLREPTANNIIQKSASGMEARIAQYPNTLDKWTLKFNYLTQGQGSPYLNSVSDYRSLMGFVRSRMLSFDSFLFRDVTDDVTQGSAALNTVTQANTGDGSTTTFQLQRLFGSAYDPIYDVNSHGVNSIVVTNGGTGYTYATASISGGAGTGASAYVVVSGGSVTQVVIQTSGQDYSSAPGVVINGDGSSAAATAYITPQVYLGGTRQTTGFSIGSTGIITFGTAPTNGVAVTADAAYYWRVRFQDDSLEFSHDFGGYWSVKKVILFQTRT